VAEDQNRDIDNEGEESAPKKKEAPVEFSTLQDVGEFINYIGNPTLLEFADPIKDRDGRVLVQVDSRLRESIFSNLQTRKASELPSLFRFNYTKDLSGKLKSLVSDSLFVCLKQDQYHIAPDLLRLSKINFLSLVSAVLDNRTVLDKLTMMNISNDLLLRHLGEAALLSGGIAERLCRAGNVREEDYPAIVKLSLTAGLLHDISLADNDNFILDDIENAIDSRHEAKSVEFIKKHLKDIDHAVIKAVGSHHRTSAIYANGDVPILTDEIIVSESLNFAEFFFGQIRSAYQFRISSQIKIIDRIFFTIGQAIGIGYFNPAIFKIMGDLQTRFKSILNYGQEIADLEKQCLFGTSAVAYPTPRCSQVLCVDKRMDCKFIQQNYPIRVVQSARHLGRTWRKLSVGDYPKCVLSGRLPEPPEEIVSLG
jgi:hypothetical protein